MFLFKFVFLLVIFCTSSLIGLFISKIYVNRVKILKDFKSAFNMFEAKIKYTYETIPEIFREISKNTCEEVSEIFYISSEKMNEMSAGKAWAKTIDNSKITISKEDKNILKGLSKLLGKTDLDGQLQEIRLTNEFLDKQILDAESKKEKNGKLYRKLGSLVGLAIVVILI